MWLDTRDSSWQQLTATEQAAAVELATASRLARRDKVAVIDFMMANGAPLGRQTAIACLAHIECPEAVERLERALDDYDPMVVATAAKILRKLGNLRAVPRLATLLDHQNLEVRTTAQGALRDFTFPKFLADFDTYEPQLRGVLARIVVHSDPQAIEHLRGELRAVTVQRKLRGLVIAREMHQAEAVVEEVLELSDHKDVEIRCEALATLAECTSIEARETLVKATGDPNALVRNRAADALRKLDERNPPQGVGL
jgi:HEAT repeat protein